jgi:hypothetical protein
MMGQPGQWLLTATGKKHGELSRLIYLFKGGNSLGN